VEVVERLLVGEEEEEEEEEVVVVVAVEAVEGDSGLWMM